jgi:hypothetical protein
MRKFVTHAAYQESSTAAARAGTQSEQPWVSDQQ